MAFISSGFRLLPYAGILPLPFSIAPASSSSLSLATSGSPKLRTFMLFPAGVSPLPSGPWHVAHFCLYSAALLSSALAGAQSMTATARAHTPGITFELQSFRIVRPPLEESKDAVVAAPTLLLERVSDRKCHEITSEISGRKDVLHCPGGRVLMVTVIIPIRFPRPVLRKLVIEASIGMQPFRVQRPCDLIRDERLRIETQLRPIRAGQVCAQPRCQMTVRCYREIEITVVRFIRIRGELLHQPRDIRTCLNAWSRLASSYANVTDQDLREDVVIVISNFYSVLFVRLNQRRNPIGTVVLQVVDLKYIVPAFPDRDAPIQIQPVRGFIFGADPVFLRLPRADSREGVIRAHYLGVKADAKVARWASPEPEERSMLVNRNF